MLASMKAIEDHVFALDNFEGPLDFLLHLVQKNEIDIYEVHLQKITEQYLTKLSALLNPAVDGGAEFIGTTASLLLLKSKMLLPRHEVVGQQEEEELDPRFEIIHQLIEYCRFKDSAKEFIEIENKQSNFFVRGLDEQVQSKRALGIDHLSLQDFASLFQVVVSRAASRRGEIREEVWRVSDKMVLVRQMLCDLKKVRFDALFSEECSRDELVVTFLAVLELMKLGELCVIRDSSQTVLLTSPQGGYDPHR